MSFKGRCSSYVGLMDETQHRLDQLQSVTQSSAQEADRKLAAALGPQALADATAKEKAQKIAVADRPGLYAQAFKLYSSGAPADMDVARELFQEYLRRYPNDPQAGEAQYYAADCFLQAKRYKEAALAFQKVPDQYPKSSKVCESRYKLGLCLMGLKMRDDARAALEETPEVLQQGRPPWHQGSEGQARRGARKAGQGTSTGRSLTSSCKGEGTIKLMPADDLGELAMVSRNYFKESSDAVWNSGDFHGFVILQNPAAERLSGFHGDGDAGQLSDLSAALPVLPAMKGSFA